MPWTHDIYSAHSLVPYWTGVSKFSDTTVHDNPDASFEFTVVTTTFTRTTPSGAPRSDDIVECNMGMTQIIGGVSEGVDIVTNGANVEGLLNSFWASVQAAAMSSEYSRQSYIWHQYKGVAAKPGPAVRTTATSGAGGATARIADQVAATVSLRTASRKHWGRIYVPGIPSSAFVTGGVLASSAIVDVMALAGRTLVNGLAALTNPVEWGVASRKFSGFLVASALEVDDIPDVQRRRRTNSAPYKKIYTS